MTPCGLCRRVFTRNLEKEQKIVEDYVKPLILDVKNMSNEVRNSMTNFILYGIETTIKLGEGERAGVLNSYKSAYNKLPEFENEWEDVLKIANGRFPSERNETSEKRAEV